MIIPSGSSCSWLVGCHVGHTYAWLRNSCAAAASARWPALLPAGWEVRTRAPGGESSWQQDAVTVDPLRGRVQTWQRKGFGKGFAHRSNSHRRFRKIVHPN